MAKHDVLLAGKWALGMAHDIDGYVLRFEFSDREPIAIAIPAAEAVQIAHAILEQKKNPPPRSRQLF